MNDAVTINLGGAKTFCCQAQMYLQNVGLPSSVFDFCDFCKGEWVEEDYIKLLEKREKIK